MDAQPEDTEDSFELVELPGGGRSLRSLANRQTFHPVVGPSEEARAVHVGGTRLVEQANGRAERFVIWDVGLGAGANALAAVDSLMGNYVRAADVRLLSFDRTAAALDFAIVNAGALDYSEQQRGWMETLRREQRVAILLEDPSLGQEAVNGSKIQWSFHQEDFPALMAGSVDLPAPNAIFFDPYSPAVNPKMWTLELFASLRARMRPEAPCLLSSYTRSTAVRVTLLLAGFSVGFGPATGEKDQTTVAVNDPTLLLRPLDRRWLERAHSSTNAAPLRAPIYTRGPIGDEDFERLRGCEQFC